MPYEITCPRCQRILHISEGNTRPSLTCPHCLASLVVNPRALVRADWPAAAKDSLDDDVGRDSRGGIIAAFVVGGLVLFGASVFVANGGPQLVSASNDGPVVFGIGFLVLGTIVAGTIAVVANSKSKTVSVLTGVFGGLLVGAGAVILAVVLVCMGIMQTCQFGR